MKTKNLIQLVLAGILVFFVVISFMDAKTEVQAQSITPVGLRDVISITYAPKSQQGIVENAYVFSKPSRTPINRGPKHFEKVEVRVTFGGVDLGKVQMYINDRDNYLLHLSESDEARKRMVDVLFPVNDIPMNTKTIRPQVPVK